MDLISRQAAYDTLTEYYHQRTETQHESLKEALSRVPTIDPVKHGKWIVPTREGCLTYDKAAYAECSECGKKEYLGWGKNYCPHCGTMMRSDESCGT